MQMKHHRPQYFPLQIEHDQNSQFMVDDRQQMLPPQFRTNTKSVSFNTSKIDISKQQFNKKQESSERKFDISSNMLEHDILSQSKLITNTVKKSLLPQILNNKINTNYDKNQFTIYFFDTDRKISFEREYEIKDLQKSIRSYIPYIVSSYCKYFLNFDPEEIPDTFAIKLANFDNKEDRTIDYFNLDWSIQRLFEAGNLVMIRKENTEEAAERWQQQKLTQDQIIIQMHTPSGQTNLQLQKNLKIKELKKVLFEKNFCDEASEIVLVGYNDLSVLESQKQIGKLDTKSLQFFKKKLPTYEDKPILRYEKNYEVIQKQAKVEDIKLKLQLTEGFFYGKSTLEIQNDQIIEKCQGGSFAKFFNWNYPKVHSIHNLVGISKTDFRVQLKFKFKNRDQIATYDFGSKQDSQDLLRCLLKIERRFNKKFKNFRQIV